jgi:hypothetical protein
MYPTRNVSGNHTVIGTHSRFTRQFLGYAQRERLARTHFYDFPVILKMKCFWTGKAASVEAALLLMASHWPPENLPLREVELRAGYTIAWMQLLSSRGNTNDTLRNSACVLSL